VYVTKYVRYFAVPPLISNLFSLHLTNIGASFSQVTPKVNGYPSTARLWNAADTTHFLTLRPCFVIPTPHYFVHPPCLSQSTPLMQHT
jgi:hypothetical protein